jgi:hypothetical protein
MYGFTVVGATTQACEHYPSRACADAIADVARNTNEGFQPDQTQ